jgi:hypothetical protein
VTAAVRPAHAWLLSAPVSYVDHPPLVARGRRVLGASGAMAGSAAMAILVYLSFLIPGLIPSTVGPDPTNPLPNQPVGPPPASGYPGPGAPASCNAGTPTPAALRIPAASPSGQLRAGGQLSASYAIGVASSNGSFAGDRVYMPSLFISFPLADGTPITLYLPPAIATLSDANWVSPPFAHSTFVSSQDLSFSGASALLSSQKLAVMASATYGTLALQFRWQWTLVQPDGTQTAGAWTTPTSQPNWPQSTPSIFFPAPYVRLISSTPSPAPIGANFTATLSAAAAGRYFLLELEYPGNGTVVAARGSYATAAGSGTYNTAFPLLGYDGYLFPGVYLVHIHDDCGAMLYSLSLTAVYASSALIQFSIVPACGSIVFNGTSFVSGSSGSFRPSSQPYTFSIPNCPGHSFSGWTTTGGLHLVSSGGMLVSASGRFSVSYT